LYTLCGTLYEANFTDSAVESLPLKRKYKDDPFLDSSSILFDAASGIIIRPEPEFVNFLG
jgi:hypothetical protein